MDKDKRFTEGALCAALFVGLAFGIVAGLAIYASAYPIFQSANWAAWAQAIGTVGSIIGAFYLFRLQAKNQLKMQKEEWEKRDGDKVRAELNKHDQVVRLLQSVVEMLQDVCRLFRGDHTDKINSRADLVAVRTQLETQLAVFQNVEYFSDPLVLSRVNYLGRCASIILAG